MQRNTHIFQPTEKGKKVIQSFRDEEEKQKEIDILNEDVVNLKVSLSSFDETVSSIDEMKEKIESDIQNFEQELRNIFGVKGINFKGSMDKGSIQIDFASRKDFDRIYNVLVNSELRIKN